MANEIMSVEGQLCGIPLAGPESFSQQQLDYLKRALGVDETVLWSNTGNKLTKDLTWPQTLSESVGNFKRVKFLFCGDSSVNKARWIEFEALNNNAYPLFDFRFDGGGNDNIFWRGAIFKLNGTSLTNEYNSTVNLTSTFSGQGFNTNGYNYLIKIVGVGRIAGGN